MNVRELIAELQNIDPDIIVVLQKDAEGNGYSPLSGITEAWYFAESTWAGEVYSSPPTAEEDQADEGGDVEADDDTEQTDDGEFDEGDDDAAAPEGSVPCVVFWPVN
jgi:hypothetical protein